MQTNLFLIDPMAASSYGIYNAVKGKKGTFVDFLLNYDSYEANKGKNDWLNKIVDKDTINKINSPEMLKIFTSSGLNTMDFLSQRSYFDTQVSAYKLQITQEMQKRNIKIPITPAKTSLL
jgi:hypothetical protein